MKGKTFFMFLKYLISKIEGLTSKSIMYDIFYVLLNEIVYYLYFISLDLIRILNQNDNLTNLSKIFIDR